MTEQGDRPPTSSCPTRTATPSSCRTLRGQPVVLYFYPKADTPGCTTQACGVRDHRADYAKAGAVVLGVSPDPVRRSRNSTSKYDLDFTLLADEDHAVADATASGSRSRCTGKKYFGNERTTFVIDADGKVAEVLRKVKPAEHDGLVLAALEQLTAA